MKQNGQIPYKIINQRSQIQILKAVLCTKICEFREIARINDNQMYDKTNSTFISALLKAS